LTGVSAVPPLIVFGFLLALLYERTGSILPGMMLHQDGSRHEWLEGQPALDLIVTLDDATGAIHSAFLIEEEGTASTFRALSEVFSQHGLPMSLYTDRGSHYFRNHQGRRDRPRLTDPGRPGP